MKFLSALLCCSALVAQPTPVSVKAQYSWGYAGPEGQGKGVLSVLLETGSGRIVMELHGLGERLLLLEGDRSQGYRVQIPRQELDQKASSLGTLPLPFLPQVGSAEGLAKLLTEGSLPGVQVTRRDVHGPVKLHYRGKNQQGREVEVWLKRTRWE